MNTTKKKECKRCGSCCYVNMIAYVTEEDLARWRAEGREDILHIIDNEKSVWMGDHLVSSKDGHLTQQCPFLIHENDGRYTCSIYTTRPAVCRNFVPGVSLMCPQYYEIDK